MKIEGLSEELLRGDRGFPSIRNALSFLDEMESIFVVLNRSGNVAYINESGCNTLCSGYDDVIGRSWFDKFVPADIRSDSQKRFYQVVLGRSDCYPICYSALLTSIDTEVKLRWDHSLVVNKENREITGTFSAGKCIANGALTAKDIVLHPGSREVFLAGHELDLSPSEFSLLEILACNQGQVVSRIQLNISLRGFTLEFGDRSLDMRISALRKKLNDRKPPYKYIKTIRAKGYLLASN